MPTQIDPLNKKRYGAVTVMLTVANVKAAMKFYQRVFGFARRGVINGSGGKLTHAELRLRDTTLMLGPESLERARSAKTIGASPVTLYLMVEDVDKVVAKAIKLGATTAAPVAEMFWGDRCGTIVDPDGNPWMVATHASEPTPQEMRKKMLEQTRAQAASATSAS